MMVKPILTKTISVDREICNGDPFVTGTRYRVMDIAFALHRLGSTEQVLRLFPGLSAHAVEACIQFEQKFVSANSPSATSGAGSSAYIG